MSTPPALNIPPSPSTVTVSIINTTISVPFPVSLVLIPIIGGITQLKANAYCFLITHPPSNQTILFDLGARKDFSSNAPALVQRLRSFGINPTIEKDVPEILEEGGLDLKEVNAVIWSHHHWDHTGDVSKFPSTTELVVGPGTSKMWPGYPANPESLLLESDYKGRPTREIKFDQSPTGLKIGRFPALDYFGDGSFYLLDAPGHAIGHMCALARTTATPPTFIFMGGDTCRHMGELRPSLYLPLPTTLSPSPLSPPKTAYTTSCPADLFLSLHPSGSATEPFYTLALDEKGESLVCVDVGEAEQTMEGAREVDAGKGVLVVMAHDASLRGVVECWPATANGWMEKGWKTEGRWRFLADFVGDNGGEARL
ncbi:hypothetical protein V502_11228 [Pseudogymnoascus sp. VKM F-4520 (FW-2644)]|nr:hypothetical protein V502_11228 [Pseudogymnoascus sp. VKM F-4520 (FW-2644)]